MTASTLTTRDGTLQYSEKQKEAQKLQCNQTMLDNETSLQNDDSEYPEKLGETLAGSNESEYINYIRRNIAVQRQAEEKIHIINKNH